MSTKPFWLRITYNAVEVVLAVLLLLLGSVLVYESVTLGAGWGAHGPNAGFFPFGLTVLAMIGSIGVLFAAYKNPNKEPFFEVTQEIVDLLKVGLPIFATILLMPWLGMYGASGVYLAFFMIYYGGFKWYSAIGGGILFSTIMWFLLFRFFNIPMPMSMLYRDGILPF